MCRLLPCCYEWHLPETELMDLGEYCEDALHEVEENGYPLQDTLYLASDGDTRPATPVASGCHTEVHCGEGT